MSSGDLSDYAGPNCIRFYNLDRRIGKHNLVRRLMIREIFSRVFTVKSIALNSGTEQNYQEAEDDENHQELSRAMRSSIH